jgi:hypothetical protein
VAAGEAGIGDRLDACPPHMCHRVGASLNLVVLFPARYRGRSRAVGCRVAGGDGEIFFGSASAAGEAPSVLTFRCQLDQVSHRALEK